MEKYGIWLSARPWPFLAGVEIPILLPRTLRLRVPVPFPVRRPPLLPRCIRKDSRLRPFIFSTLRAK